MQTIPVEGHKPIFSWCPNIEDSALQQAESFAKLPFVQHVALMPDCHWGMGVPIGSVVATDGVIIPSAVGNDISCGVAAFKTNLRIEDFSDEMRKAIHHAVERTIPFGFSHNSDKRKNEIETIYANEIIALFNGFNSETYIVEKKEFAAQLGTCGGGNHFLEVQYDETGAIWVMVHSGSRNIGKKVCDYFNDLATSLNKQWYSSSEIPFLPVQTIEGQDYLDWMNLCVRFSYLNRKIMLRDVVNNLLHYFPNMQIITKTINENIEDDIINISHNYARLEHHFGKNVFVHRKGATFASNKTIGIIPGAMEQNSFITIGLGNANSLNSCSHGAGRKCGRKEFNVNNQSRVKDIEERIKSKGIVFSKFQKATRGKDEGMYDISESGEAYKDVVSVMEEQVELVKPLVKLTPIISWKG